MTTELQDTIKPLVEDLAFIDRDVEATLRLLTIPQQKFAVARAVDNCTIKEACRRAGLKTAPKDDGGWVAHATSMLMLQHQLRHGIDAGWKRKQLVEISREAREAGNQSAATTAIRLLAEMDGDIKTVHGATGSQVTVNIVTGIDRQPERPAIEHDDEPAWLK